MKDAVDHEWGDYYISGLQKGKKKNWILETIYQINQLIPSFNEVFDRETFYVFVFLVIAASIVFIYLMTSVFKIKVREHDFIIFIFSQTVQFDHFPKLYAFSFLVELLILSSKFARFKPFVQQNHHDFTLAHPITASFPVIATNPIILPLKWFNVPIYAVHDNRKTTNSTFSYLSEISGRYFGPVNLKSLNYCTFDYCFQSLLALNFLKMFFIIPKIGRLSSREAIRSHRNTKNSLRALSAANVFDIEVCECKPESWK
uniref:Uncharacterized protein n=1 Tax=Panagrolaimus sp. JU765 TaxID=591449 RepID=A0AC34QRC3_9BILA